MKKVLHIIPTLSRVRGGSDLATYELSKAQADIGLDVSVIYFKTVDDYPKDGSLSYVAINGGIAGGIIYFMKLFYLVSQSDFIHVHSSWRLLNSIGGYLGLIFEKVVFFQPHGAFEDFRMTKSRKVKNFYLRFIERRLLLRSQVVYEGDSEKKVLDRLGVKTFYLPCGSNMPIKTGEKSKNKDIVFLGRFDFHKGVIELVQALIVLETETSFDFKVHLCGYDTDGTLERVVGLVTDSDLEDKIIIHPAVFTMEEKINYLDLGSAFILPSHSENFGIAALEGCLRGLFPLVSYNTPWSKILGEANGLFFESNPDSILGALKRWRKLNDEEYKIVVGENNDIVSNRFTWPKIASNLWAYMQDVYAPKN